uniref:Uncharacterized protein n=1 Tax=Geobacter sp. (strain M21) TaxID=443144 RepID=C6E4A1_GEOSM
MNQQTWRRLDALAAALQEEETLDGARVEEVLRLATVGIVS